MSSISGMHVSICKGGLSRAKLGIANNRMPSALPPSIFQVGAGKSSRLSMRFLGFSVELGQSFMDDDSTAGGRFGVNAALGNMNAEMFVGVGSIAESSVCAKAQRFVKRREIGNSRLLIEICTSGEHPSRVHLCARVGLSIY